MRASVENHVFQEVGDALDVVRFIQGTRIDAQADAEPALGLCVRADEVGQPVGELSLDKPGILLGNACRRLDSGGLGLVFCCGFGQRIFYSVLGGWLNPKAGYQLFFSVQPFADVVGNYTCQNREKK